MSGNAQSNLIWTQCWPHFEQNVGLEISWCAFQPTGVSGSTEQQVLCWRRLSGFHGSQWNYNTLCDFPFCSCNMEVYKCPNLVFQYYSIPFFKQVCDTPEKVNLQNSWYEKDVIPRKFSGTMDAHCTACRVTLRPWCKFTTYFIRQHYIPKYSPAETTGRDPSNLAAADMKWMCEVGQPWGLE